jgi:hypothetical protein
MSKSSRSWSCCRRPCSTSRASAASSTRNSTCGNRQALPRTLDERADRLARPAAHLQAGSPYLARTLPQLPRLAHQQLAQPARVDLQPQLAALIAAQNRQNRWLAVIALMLALLVGSRYL